MSENIAQILAELRSGLEELYGNRLERLILFGSQARGDATSNSDIDVLVVLSGEVYPVEEIRRTSRMVADLSLRTDTDLGVAFISAERYLTERSPFVLNVQREGIAI